MKECNFINPKKIVNEMRKQRAFLVQNWVYNYFLYFGLIRFIYIFSFWYLNLKEQYKFIHQTLLEWCLFDKSTICIDDRDLCKSLISDVSKIEAEYEV